MLSLHIRSDEELNKIIAEGKEKEEAEYSNALEAAA
jgi:hypothetical protein